MKKMQNRIIILLWGLLGSLWVPPELTAQGAWIPGPFPPGTLPLERIVLQTDRDLYISGEDIWFTATCSLTNAGAMKQMSQVVYVELFNSQHEVLLREKFPMRDRVASGRLEIPAEAATDACLLRAYTNYQRNFPPESFAMKCLTIINPDIPYEYKLEPADEIIIIPEGGSLVSGCPSRIAVRVETGGPGTKLRALLTDQRGRTVAPVRMFPGGLGVCEFTPVDSLSYALRIIRKEGDTITGPLPPAERTGFSPSLRHTPEGLVYQAGGVLPESDYKGDSLILCVKSAEMITLDEIRLKRSQMPLRLVIPYPDLYRGMIYLVLKESTGEILHVLPAFIPPAKAQSLTVETERSVYSCREEATVSIQAPGTKDEPIRLTVAVVKQGLERTSGSQLDGSSIRNPFLIHSLSGQVEIWDDKLTEQADLCMILYTPRVNTLLFRSGLAAMERGGLNFLPDIRDVSLSGQVTSKKTKEGAPAAQVILSVLGQSQLHMARTDPHGRFVFPLNNLTGEQHILLAPHAQKDHNVEILVHQDFSGQFPDQLDLVPVLDSSLRDKIEETWINAQVTRFNPPLLPEVSPGAAADILFAEERVKVVLSDYIGMTSLYEVFWEIVPFVQIRKKKDHYQVQITNDRLEVYEDPLVLLDNVPVSSVDELLKVPPALVDRIEVINHPYIHGDFVLNGALMVYTITENFAGSSFPAGSVFLDYQTITPPADFPVYDYSTEKQKTGRMPDFRNVLHWDPGLVLRKHKAAFTFYTSDHCGDYDVVVRGMGSDGKCYSGKSIFRVTQDR
ncbi:MAG TPA: hypothetical protein PKH94_07920 [Bacteroidales bacterium]|nr:hypothetical protein [Bacteroidales bacterium]HNS47149.1 hypothetical protein [Bacteroidales bacterium]